MIVARSSQGLAIVYSSIESLHQDGFVDYLEVEALPTGEGMLMTDLRTLWWEPLPKPEPEPEPEPTKEDPYAEMAQAIREGVNEV